MSEETNEEKIAEENVEERKEEEAKSNNLINGSALKKILATAGKDGKQARIQKSAKDAVSRIVEIALIAAAKSANGHMITPADVVAGFKAV